MIVLTDEDIILELIKTKFKKFFSVKQLVHELIAKQKEISLRDIYFDHYDIYNCKKFQQSNSIKITCILRKLRDRGLIEKYSKRIWKKRKIK